MNNIIEKLNLNVDENIKNYLNEMSLVKIVRANDNTIFIFYIESKVFVPYKIKESIEKSITNDFLKNSSKAYVNFIFNKESIDEIDKQTLFNEYIDKYLYNYLLTYNKIYANLYDNSVKNFDIENNILNLTVSKNNSIKMILENMKKVISDYIKECFLFDIIINYSESEELKKDVVVKKIEEKNKYFEEMQKKLAQYEKDIEEKNKLIKEKEDIEETEEQKNKRIAKKRKCKIKTFYDDGDEQIYGAYIKDTAPIFNIGSIMGEINNITIKGYIFNFTFKEDLKSKKTGKKFNILNFDVTDGKNSISCTMFAEKDDIKKAKNVLSLNDKKGESIEVLIAGNIKLDGFTKELCLSDITGIRIISHKNYIFVSKKKQEDCYRIFTTDRVDEEYEKRVELHLHTKFSEQDGVGDVKDYLRACDKFGMKSIAITDHGVLQALPVAYNYLKGKKKNGISNDIKLILGVEGYLVDDDISIYMDNNFNKCEKSFDINDTFVVFDILTTGINFSKDLILSISVTKIKNKTKIVEKTIHIKPDRHLTFEEKNRTNFKESDFKNDLDFKSSFIELVNFIYEGGNDVCICGLNIKKDIEFIKNYIDKINDSTLTNSFEKFDKILDLSALAKFIIKDVKKFTRETILKYYKLDKNINKLTKDKLERKKYYYTNEMSYQILQNMLSSLADEYLIKNLNEINEKFVIDENYIKNTKYNHIILLAKNDVGRTNLYKLVSDSHIDYFNKRPRMPRSLISKYREGLIVGSACVQGELVEAIIEGENDDNLKNIVKFYDYLEIQPINNNSFLLNNEKYNELFTSNEDLININKKIVELGDELDKIVVATSDCHYVDKEDKIYRTILQYNVWHKKTNIDKDGNVKISDNDESSSEKEELYFRTTKEMLDEFYYLGEKKAFEVVVKNTNMISDMCENIAPTRPDKAPPSIENADELLRDTCINNAKSIYGENLPKIIEDRLDVELHKIIDNGYSVLYITAKKLIDDSVEHGYMVGSRGSVGSSLVATMIGVSEVNPLPPHYVCKNCHHVEIDTEETNKYLNETGFDMPDKLCPICNTKMKKDGINIPFETFLGVDGKEKEPDIDLNFSGEYQIYAHEKTREIFGDSCTFKAGTMQTVAKENSYHYIKKYNDENNTLLKKVDIEYLKTGIMDCKKSTGQHPGGMVVLPRDEYIYTFTPIQYPANKKESGKTTHFEYHEIDSNLLKLDILGQDGPTFMKKLKDLTNVDPIDVEFYKEEVLSLFKDLSSINLKKEDIHNEKLGCLSIPEFGTTSTMKMCIEAKPKSVADLIRISGLAHGTNVWVGNIRDIVLNNIATINECVCCRDDIMLYLNERGLDNLLSFEIMESVRKGKKLTKEWEEKMRDKGVPGWYIDCCNKIEYMFPKAHAAAYVTLSLRVGYYKIYYPIEYYTAFFSIKWRYFNYELMCGNIEFVRYNIDKILSDRKNEKNKNNANLEWIIDENKTEEEVSVDLNDNSLEENIDENMEDENDEESKTANQEKKVKVTLTMLKICEECLARGIEFAKIDIYKAKPFDFIIDDGKIMPALITIDGLGKDKVENLYNEAQTKKFESKEDLIKRTKISQTVFSKLVDLGILTDLVDDSENEDIKISDFLN